MLDNFVYKVFLMEKKDGKDTVNEKQEETMRKNTKEMPLLRKQGSKDSMKKDSASENLARLSQSQIPHLIKTPNLVGDRRAAVSEKDEDQRETLKESLEYIQRVEYLKEYQLI